MDKRVKRNISWLAGIIAVLFIVTASTLMFYFIDTDAPMIYGEVEWEIPYNENFKLDIYHPTKYSYIKTPVVLFIHGGAWIAGSKETVNNNRFNGAFNELRQAGYAIVSPNYTLANKDKSPFPACIHDAYDALEWIYNNAEKYNFDLNNVGVFGESAGAHISMMIAWSQPQDFSINYNKKNLNYIVNVYGPNDLEDLFHMQNLEDFNSILSRLPEPVQEQLDISRYLFGFDPEADTLRAKELMHKFSPIQYLNESSPPIIIVHGDKDEVVPIGQSRKLNTLLTEMKVAMEYRELPGVDHAFRESSEQHKDSVQYWISNFIRKNYSTQ